MMPEIRFDAAGLYQEDVFTDNAPLAPSVACGRFWRAASPTRRAPCCSAARHNC